MVLCNLTIGSDSTESDFGKKETNWGDINEMELQTYYLNKK